MQHPSGPCHRRHSNLLGCSDLGQRNDTYAHTYTHARARTRTHTERERERGEKDEERKEQAEEAIDETLLLGVQYSFAPLVTMKGVAAGGSTPVTRTRGNTWSFSKVRLLGSIFLVCFSAAELSL